MLIPHLSWPKWSNTFHDSSQKSHKRMSNSVSAVWRTTATFIELCSCSRMYRMVLRSRLFLLSQSGQLRVRTEGGLLRSHPVPFRCRIRQMFFHGHQGQGQDVKITNSLAELKWDNWRDLACGWRWRVTLKSILLKNPGKAPGCRTEL